MTIFADINGLFRVLGICLIAGGLLAPRVVDASTDLALSEIMYHPPGNSTFEYLEFYNNGADPIDLSNYQFVEGISFVFPSGTTLDPDAYLLVVEDPLTFNAVYGAGLPVAGQYTGKLDNSGERLVLNDALGTPVLTVEFNDGTSWPPRADGEGSSLELNHLGGDLSVPQNWRDSVEYLGSPGRAGDPTAPTVVINEVLSHTDAPYEDAVELYNPGDAAVEIGGWYLSDSSGTLKKYQIPAGRVIQPKSYAVFFEIQFNATNALIPFSLSSAGESVWLISTTDAGKLHKFVDVVRFDGTESNRSIGRYKTSYGIDFAPLESPMFGATPPATLGAFRFSTGWPNSGALTGPVVINELMYHPPDLPGGIDHEVPEYIELLNTSAGAIQLYDPEHNNPWTLDGAVQFSFPAEAVLESGALALVVGFDPVSSPTQRAEFFANYPDLPLDVALYGPWLGKLNNSGERVALYRPDEPTLEGEVPRILQDWVYYYDTHPFPKEADGAGYALERIEPSQYGNEPKNWALGPLGGTPGLANNQQNAVGASWVLYGRRRSFEE